ncbi:MAG: hypothetical protein LBJ67_13145 [Planctomycetaceae bacterium]|nr:hypothetical protein [Planctomycetaceae bacterium]
MVSPIIQRFVPVGKRFFKRLDHFFGCDNFAHFWRLMFVFASTDGRTNVSKFTKLFVNRRTRQAIMHFLTEA